MYRLKRPADGAGRGIERHHRTRVFLRLRGALCAVVIRVAVACWDVDEAEALVGAERCPAVRGIARVLLTRSGRCVDVGMTQIPGPSELSRDGVKGPDDAGRVVHLSIVDHHAAEDDHTA